MSIKLNKISEGEEHYGDLPDVIALIHETNRRLAIGEITWEVAAEIQNNLVGGEGCRGQPKELGSACRRRGPGIILSKMPLAN